MMILRRTFQLAYCCMLLVAPPSCYAFMVVTHHCHQVPATRRSVLVLRQSSDASSSADSSSSDESSSSSSASSSSSSVPPPANAQDLFASKGWKPIESDLNRLPVFTCANEQGKPLAYTVETRDDEAFTVPFFYCDVDDALQELAKAKENTGLDNLDILPYPLGKAFQMWATDQAVIVPNKNAIMQAGAPPNTNPIGQHVPLFACMDIMRTNEDGSGTVLPLFMALEEANAAVAQAVELDGGSVDDFDVVSLSLNRAVELLATVPETPAFQFVAPEKSFQYINKYLSDFQ